MPNNKNIELIKGLRQRISKSSSILFAETIGMTASQMNDLRKKVKEIDADVNVAKNTLLKKALQEENIETTELEADLKGQTTAIFSYKDPIAALKVIIEFAKNVDLPKVKAAIVDGVYANTKQVEVLSTLPSREVLLAKVTGSLKSPLYGLHNVLVGSQRKFIYALSALAEKRGN